MNPGCICSLLDSDRAARDPVSMCKVCQNMNDDNFNSALSRFSNQMVGLCFHVFIEILSLIKFLFILGF